MRASTIAMFSIVMLVILSVAIRDASKHPSSKIVIKQASDNCTQYIDKSHSKRECMFNVIETKCTQGSLDLEVCGYQKALLAK